MEHPKIINTSMVLKQGSRQMCGLCEMIQQVKHCTRAPLGKKLRPWEIGP